MKVSVERKKPFLSIIYCLWKGADGKSNNFPHFSSLYLFNLLYSRCCHELSVHSTHSFIWRSAGGGSHSHLFLFYSYLLNFEWTRVILTDVVILVYVKENFIKYTKSVLKMAKRMSNVVLITGGLEDGAGWWEEFHVANTLATCDAG